MKKVRDLVTEALELFARGMAPFVQENLRADGQSVPDELTDPQAVVKLMLDHWQVTFRQKLSVHKTAIYAIRDLRNDWAHHKDITGPSAFGPIEYMRSLVEKAGATELADRLSQLRDSVNAPQPAPLPIPPAPAPAPAPAGEFSAPITAQKERVPGPVNEALEVTANETPLAKSDKARAKLIHRWQSQTQNSEFINDVIEAYIEDVTYDGTTTSLSYIDELGRSRQIRDFGKFERVVFEYLEKHKERRAVFIVTRRPGGPFMLAPQTMMYYKHRHFWAN